MSTATTHIAPAPVVHAVIQDAHDAWVQGADETRGFPDFATWAMYALERNHMAVHA